MKNKWKWTITLILIIVLITTVIIFPLLSRSGNNDQSLTEQVVVQPIDEQLSDEAAMKETDIDEAFSLESVQGSCVRVQANGHHGSGIIFKMTEDEMIIATNRHVLQYWDEDSYVTFFNGAVGNGRAVALSEKADVGFISIYTAFLTEEERKDLRAVDTVDEPPGAGTKIYMIDMASDVWNPVVYEGKVLEPQRYLEDFGMEMLYGEAASKPGMSGTGVFDVNGQFLGMLTGGTDANEIAAVPTMVLDEEYERTEQ